MSGFASRLTGFIDSVLGLAPRPLAETRREVPCNIFSGFMIFGCRQGK
jgi:hypothetical protein